MIKQITGEVVEGLRNSPALLAVVVLQLVSVLAMIWFLHELAQGARTDREQMLTVIEKCFSKTP